MKIVSITLRNFLILREAEIELHPGMNVVTGETGSGKSLFVEAIKLLMGGKGARHLAGKWGPNGEVTAVIEVEKNDAELRNRLDFFGIELEDDSRFTVRRKIG